jgi:hypothetical protein
MEGIKEKCSTEMRTIRAGIGRKLRYLLFISCLQHLFGSHTTKMGVKTQKAG